MLIWGASGGLGSYATRFTLNGGAIPGLRRLLPGEGRDLPRMGAKHIIDRSAELALLTVTGWFALREPP